MAYEMQFEWKTPEQAKAIVKQLKLKKKEVMMAKSELSKQIAQVHADHRSRVAKRGSKMQGGGSIGRIVRAFDTDSRDRYRLATDKAVRSLESKKSAFDADARRIDQAILTVEQWIVDNKPESLAPKAPRGKQPDVVDQLERLGKLRDAGVLSAGEFDAKKQELLSRL